MSNTVTYITTLHGILISMIRASIVAAEDDTLLTNLTYDGLLHVYAHSAPEGVPLYIKAYLIWGGTHHRGARESIDAYMRVDVVGKVQSTVDTLAGAVNKLFINNQQLSWPEPWRGEYPPTLENEFMAKEIIQGEDYHLLGVLLRFRAHSRSRI